MDLHTSGQLSRSFDVWHLYLTMNILPWPAQQEKQRAQKALPPLFSATARYV